MPRLPDAPAVEKLSDAPADAHADGAALVVPLHGGEGRSILREGLAYLKKPLFLLGIAGLQETCFVLTQCLQVTFHRYSSLRKVLFA